MVVLEPRRRVAVPPHRRRPLRTLDNSPVKLLGAIDQARLEQLQQDDGFLAHMDRVEEALNHYMDGPTWFQETYGPAGAERAASPISRAEFGIHESVPVYSGGLGVLAGDHLKSASDLGVPLVGVGLMYREGYFRQYLNVDGWQQERYPENDFFNLPLIPETDARTARPLLVSVPFPGREVWCRIWRIQVGRVPLYLLDTQHPAEHARRPQHHRPALRRRQRHAHPAGNGPRHRRHPRPAGPRQDADRLPHERRAIPPSAAWSASAC